MNFSRMPILIVSAVLAISLAGAARANQTVTTTVTAKNVVAPLADAGTADAKSSSAKPLDEAAALAKVGVLPEVKAVEAELKKAKVAMVIRRDDDGSAPFQFAIAEDHDDHQVTRYRFMIDPASGAITAYEVECDLWSTLAKWRALRKRMAAMTPAQRDALDTCAELSK